jgi:hypothetical protein
MNRQTVPPHLQEEVRRVLADSRKARAMAEKVLWEVSTRRVIGRSNLELSENTSSAGHELRSN